jgi:hypothetical protein
VSAPVSRRRSTEWIFPQETATVKTPAEGRVPDEGRLLRLAPQALQRREDRLGMRLVVLRLLRGDNRVEVALEREDGEGEIHGLPPLRRDDAELPPLGVQALEHALDALEGDEVVVERRVVLAVDADELVGALLVEGSHLLVDVGAADRGREHLVRDLAFENRLGGVPERGDDDLPRVDQRAVEIEEDGRIAHA